eukprot:Gb_33436 [translate_table: standard]
MVDKYVNNLDGGDTAASTNTSSVPMPQILQNHKTNIEMVDSLKTRRGSETNNNFDIGKIDRLRVPIFIYLLAFTNEDDREQDVRALKNIFGDSPKYRDLFIDHGVMVHLPAQFTNATILSMIRDPTWTLSNFYRRKPQPQIDRDVIKANICPKLLELLLHPLPIALVPALRRTVGSIVTSDDMKIQIHGIFKELEEIKFALEPLERETGNVLIALLQHDKDPNGPRDTSEPEVLHQAAMRLGIISSKVILMEKRGIKRLLEKTRCKEDKREGSITLYLLYFREKYNKLFRSDYTDDIDSQNSKPCSLSVRISTTTDNMCGRNRDKQGIKALELPSSPPLEPRRSFCCQRMITRLAFTWAPIKS